MVFRAKPFRKIIVTGKEQLWGKGIICRKKHCQLLKDANNILFFSSTLPIQQAVAYSISCSKAEKEIDMLQDGPRTIPNICHLLDPPTFSLVPTFNLIFCTVSYLGPFPSLLSV
jgi:hypothetical protein